MFNHLEAKKLNTHKKHQITFISKLNPTVDIYKNIIDTEPISWVDDLN